jgi:L-lactate dehydrogenase (cytochrome)
MTRKMSTPTISVEEMKKHSNDKDCWIVVNDTVWDITDFVPSHPGGNDSEHNLKFDFELY